MRIKNIVLIGGFILGLSSLLFFFEIKTENYLDLSTGHFFHKKKLWGITFQKEKGRRTFYHDLLNGRKGKNLAVLLFASKKTLFYLERESYLPGEIYKELHSYYLFHNSVLQENQQYIQELFENQNWPGLQEWLREQNKIFENPNDE